jgi:glycosyltransferase involved in cell wall biosynthesis
MALPDAFVSVIIPTARRSNLVLRAVQSVLTQTYRALELIVVIDGPDPATEEVLRAVDDVRFRVVSLTEPKGGGNARNRGVELARGPWVAFLDDDDEWLPEKLARQTARASPDENVLVTCLSHVVSPIAHYVWPRRIYDNCEPISEYLFARRSLTLGEGHLQTSTFLLPLRLMLRYPFQPVARHQDWDLILRLFAETQMRIETVREPLVKYYIEDGRQSLGNGGDWRGSLDWLDSMRDFITRKAYSGFCMTVVAHRVALYGTVWDGLVTLRKALKNGAPTLRQLAVFAAILVVPHPVRLRARTVLQRQRPA